MTLRDLKRVDAKYRASVVKAEALRVEREQAIVAAVRAGVSQREVAQALSMTEGRVSQIMRRAPRSP